MELNITNDKIMDALNPQVSEDMTDQAVSEYIKAEMRAGFKASILIGRELRVFLNDGRHTSLGFETEKKYLESLQAENLWSVATSYNWMAAAVLADVMEFDVADIAGYPKMAIYKAGSLLSSHKVAEDKLDSFRAMVLSLKGMIGADAVDAVQKWEYENSAKRTHGNSGNSGKRSATASGKSDDNTTESDDSSASDSLKITARVLRCEMKFTGKALDTLYSFLKSNGVPAGKIESMGGEVLLQMLAKHTTAKPSAANLAESKPATMGAVN